jgi:diacylglycerol kinase family enzyme
MSRHFLPFGNDEKLMKTTLIYNPKSGPGMKLGPEKIMELLRKSGHDPTHVPTESEADLDRALAEVEDLVVVAGGDGTIRAVAIRLLGRDVKIAPIPMGTANNIAHLLALAGNPLEIVAGLADPMQKAVDIGRVQTPDGPAYFLESMGAGAFADVLNKSNPQDGKSISRTIQSMLDTLKDYQSKFFHISLDGKDLSGSYFLIEIMNTPTMGLRYMLAPDAKADDGLLDLVLIHANQRENYLKFMAGALVGKLESFPTISMQRGRKLEIAWRGFPLHLDAEVVSGTSWIERYESSAKMDASNSLDVPQPYLKVEVLPGAIQFLVPRSAAIKGGG